MIDSVFFSFPLLYLIFPVAFILGSIPFGIVFTKSRGIDIRSVGSKNIGATNVLRSAGKVPAILTLLGDILKGTAAVLICKIALEKSGLVQYPTETLMMEHDLWLGLASITAVLGHMYSVFLSFKGGKGVATGFGVLSVYSPSIAIIMFFIWLLTAFIFKFSSLAAIIAFSALPFLLLFSGASAIKIILGLLLTLLIIYKHHSNIKNLISGAETKIGGK